MYCVTEGLFKHNDFDKDLGNKTSKDLILVSEDLKKKKESILPKNRRRVR